MERKRKFSISVVPKITVYETVCFLIYLIMLSHLHRLFSSDGRITQHYKVGRLWIEAVWPILTFNMSRSLIKENM